MNNKGGGASGTWSICAGASQSYANGDWTGTVATPNAQPMSGILPSGEQIVSDLILGSMWLRLTQVRI